MPRYSVVFLVACSLAAASNAFGQNYTAAMEIRSGESALRQTRTSAAVPTGESLTCYAEVVIVDPEFWVRPRIHGLVWMTDPSNRTISSQEHRDTPGVRKTWLITSSNTNVEGNYTCHMSVFVIDGALGFWDQAEDHQGIALVCAKPTNFRTLSAEDRGNGVLYFTYAWDSTTGTWHT